MNYKKLTFILFIFLFILLNLSLVIGANKKEQAINNYFRIHVVANSDNIDDQILKLHVAKNVESYIQTLTKETSNKNELIQIIYNNIYNILDVAKTTILDNNQDYEVTAYIGKIKYDEKTKDNITMSEGIYDSLKIVIGNGNGENWWSLLFPHSIQNYEIDEVMSSDDITFSSGIFDFICDVIDIF